MSKRGHVPFRMCMGCRQKRKKKEMVRFIQSSQGVMFFDEKMDLDGRGFYLCPDLRCLKMVQKKNRMGSSSWTIGSFVSTDTKLPQWIKGLEKGRKGNDED